MGRRKNYGLEFELVNSLGSFMVVFATLSTLEAGLGYVRVEKKFTENNSTSDKNPTRLRVESLNPYGPEQFRYELSYSPTAPLQVRVELLQFFPEAKFNYNHSQKVSYQQFLDRIENFIFPALRMTNVQRIPYSRDRFCVDKILS